MSSFDYQNSTITKYRTGTSDDPYIDITETKKVINGQILLNEIPVLLNKVRIDNMFEVPQTSSDPLSENEYRVDYSEGIVSFHPSVEGLTLTVKYKGRGNHYVSSARIWTQEQDGNVTQTLADVTKAASNFYYTGTYSPSTQYQTYNIVRYLGSSYLCVKPTVGNDPTDETYWRLLSGYSFRGTYSSGTVYDSGDMVIDTNNKKLLQSKIDNNKNNQLSDTTKWQLLIDISDIVAAANAATASALSAADEAISAATNADAAANAANSAKENADTATSNANNATASANSAANSANNLVNTFISKGQYNPSTAYVPNNIVIYNGSSWRCLKNSTGNEPTEGTYWTLVASKGVDGNGAVSKVNNIGPDASGNVTLTASSIGAETPTGAQTKVDSLAGQGNTKTVKQLDDEIGILSNLNTKNKKDLVSAVNENVAFLIENAESFLNVMSPPPPLAAPLGNGANDTAALQAAINAAANKAICYIPNLTFLTKALSIPSNTHLIIAGTLKLMDGANDQLLYIPAGNSNIVIEGSGTLDGNSNKQTANLISCIYGGSIDSENIVINGLQVKNARTWGVNLTAKKSKLLNLTISSCSNMSFFGPGSEDVEIRGCEVFNISPDWGLGFYGGVKNGILTNCIAHDCAQVGLGVLADEAQNHPSYNIVISNCISYNNGYAGIGANGGESDGIIIANNVVYGNNKDGTAPTTLGGGINIAGVKHVRVKGNMTSGNRNAGLILAGTVSNIDITENSFFNELFLGIWTTYANISHLNITNNSFDDDQQTTTMNNCINFQVTTMMSDVNIMNNYFGRIISGQVKIYKGTLTVDRIINNIGYNPVGVLETPPLPATDVYYTNSTGLKCDVYISGGTVTDIYIDGSATGLNRGCFTLYPGQKIAVVYTAAPTWKWFGE